MLNQNFAFADGYAILTDEELSVVQGGKSFMYNLGYGVGQFARGVADGIKFWL